MAGSPRPTLLLVTSAVGMRLAVTEVKQTGQL
jgi:hypothetical protein